MIIAVNEFSMCTEKNVAIMLTIVVIMLTNHRLNADIS